MNRIGARKGAFLTTPFGARHARQMPNAMLVRFDRCRQLKHPKHFNARVRHFAMDRAPSENAA
ncbi:MAG: hypothetical protein U1F33_06000 [Alphaproteobacteria bacterium]